MRRVLLILLVLAGAVAALAWYRHQAPPTQTGRRANRGGPVPVLVATATVGDVPVYLDAIGTVQATNTANIRSMVDGPLVAVPFHEGQDVKTGALLARIDPRPYQATLDQYTAKKAQDEASLANAKLDLIRYQKLAPTAYTSAQTADTQRALVAQDEALVKQDQAQIDSARTQLSYTEITSPFDGRTGIRQVDIGNIVHASDTTPITVLTQLQPIFVVFTLPQQNLPQIQAALHAGGANVLATPQGITAKDWDQGQLTVLDNEIDSSTGTAKLKASFPNTNLHLWPGGFVATRLLVETEHGVITVPPAAIQRGPTGSYVYIAGTDHRAHRQNVTLGTINEQLAVVSGVEAGASVITDGASRLNDGSAIALPGENPADIPQQAHHHRRTP